MATYAFAVEGKWEQALRESGPTGVVATAKALSAAKGAEVAVDELSQLLQHYDNDIELRAVAVHVLGAMGDKGKVALPRLILTITYDHHGELTEILADLGAGDIPMWLIEKALRPAGDAQMAYYAAERLDIQDDRVMPLLNKGLLSNDVTVQWRAVTLLARLGPEAVSARPVLLRLLQEGPEEPEPQVKEGPEELISLAKVRAKAAFALGCIGKEPEETVHLLIRMLKHKDPKIRIGAAEGLGQLGRSVKAAIAPLVECLADEKMRLSDCDIFDLKHAASDALVAIGRPAIQEITQALEAKPVNVRRRAAKVLGRFGAKAKAATDSLFQRLKDPEAKVRSEAAEALGMIVPDSKRLAAELIRLAQQDEDRQIRNRAMTICFGSLKLPETTLAALAIPLLDDSDSNECCIAVAYLANRTPHVAEEAAIQWLLKVDKRAVREAAAALLKKAGPEAKSSVPIFIEMLKDQKRSVRYSAAVMLGKIGQAAQQAVPELINLLRSKDLADQHAAVLGLTGIGREAKTAIPLLIAILKDGSASRDVREHTPQAIAKIGPAKTVVPMLLELLEGNESDEVRRLSAYALGKFGPEAKAAIPTLMKLFKTYDGHAIFDGGQTDPVYTAIAIQEIEPAETAIPVFIQSLSNPDPYVQNITVQVLKWIGAPAVPSMMELLKSGNWTVRLAAIEILGTIGAEAKTAVPSLTLMLQARSSRIRSYAATALGDIGLEAKTAIPALMELLRDPKVQLNAIYALGQIGSDAHVVVPALMELLRDPKVSVRQAATEALGEIGPQAKAAIPLLTQIIKNPEEDGDVREAAEESMKAIGKIGGYRKPGWLL